MAAFWFTILLNMKHIYIYMAPAYFVYLLCNYCFQFKSAKKISLMDSFRVKNTIRLGCVVLMVFAITFLPFYDHIPQVSLNAFAEELLFLWVCCRCCPGCFHLKGDCAMRIGRQIYGRFIMLLIRWLHLQVFRKSYI